MEEIGTSISETATSKTGTATTETMLEEIETRITRENIEKNEETTDEDLIYKITTIKKILLNKEKVISDYEVKNVFDIVYIKQTFLYG